MILVLNCGSSSVKFALLDLATKNTIIQGLVEQLGTANAAASYKHAAQKYQTSLGNVSYQGAFNYIAHCLQAAKITSQQIIAVGHRVVHGGEHFKKSVIIDEQVLAQLTELSSLAPLHNPASISGIRAAQKLFNHLHHVAVFDTAFHQTMPAPAYMYAVPYAWYEENGVRKYGFHGTSHQYVGEQAAKILGIPWSQANLITVHLGNGCSATAVKNGISVDTTMGLTPLEGLVMGTRSGDLDPNILPYMVEQRQLTLAEVTEALHKQSGLQGLSGSSNDMRELLALVEQGNERAQLAVDVFCYRLSKAIAALVVALDRLDAVVFTGGIGENAAPIRARVLQQLALFGFVLDIEANNHHGQGNNGRITVGDRPAALVIATNEELKIAEETSNLLPL